LPQKGKFQIVTCYMKLRTTLPCLLILYCACSSQKSTDDSSSASDETSDTTRQFEQPVLQSKVELFGQARRRADAIGRNTNNFSVVKSDFPWRGDKVEIIEYNERLGGDDNHRRKMLTCKAASIDRFYANLIGVDTLMEAKRSYYYDDNQLFFLNEVLVSPNGEEPIVNEYYFENGSLAGWIKDGRDMEADPAYKTSAEQVRTWLSQQPENYYSFFTGFYRNSQPHFLDENSTVIVDKFVSALKLAYPEIDSIESGITPLDFYDVIEIFYHQNGRREAALYLLEFDNSRDAESGMVGILPHYVGKHDWTHMALQTPGDVFYFLMTMKRENNVAALRKLIRKTGYHEAISDGSEESSVEEANTIPRDSVDFHALRFEPNMYKVNMKFSFDEKFDDEGNGTFKYSAGGYYFTVLLTREKKQVYLNGYDFHGH
jgi:hypothetical protein